VTVGEEGLIVVYRQLTLAKGIANRSTEMPNKQMNDSAASGGRKSQGTRIMDAASDGEFIKVISAFYHHNKMTLPNNSPCFLTFVD
jgi:hypothetical protein